jgi:hypothetical protein
MYQTLIKMKIYEIPVTYEMIGTLKINAESLDDAVIIAESGTLPLPQDSRYIESSINVIMADVEDKYPEE